MSKTSSAHSKAPRTTPSECREKDKDQQGEVEVKGRYQTIPANPAAEFKKATLAAGAVVWRRTGGSHAGDSGTAAPEDVEFLLIHRPRYDDWSLAKGKVDPGESIPTTAAREILEETGYEVNLEKLVGTVHYPVVNRTKVVYYFTASVLSGTFQPNEEVDEIRWLSYEQARELLSYDVDRGVLEKARKRIAVPVTSRLLVVRHAHAHSRRKWSGDDNLRPLDKKGRRQAELLVPMLLPYHPQRVYSAEPDRCIDTAAPLADELGCQVQVDPSFGDQCLIAALVQAQDRLREVIAQPGTSVVVSQGRYIPDMVAWLSATGRLPLDAQVEAKKASVWVLSFTDGELTGADYLASPLPLR